MREKVGKSRNTVFFQWFVAPEGRKVGSLKRRVRSQLARREMKNFTPLLARSTFASQNVQNTPLSDHFWKLRCRKSVCRCGAKHISKSKCAKHTIVGPLFGSCDVEKVYAVVKRSTFPSQNVQNTPLSDHFWKLRCRKSARRCGAKHISKSKCTKHTRFGPLLEVAMSKKCTPLWREAHFQVKMCKTPQCRTTFGSSDVEKCTPLGAKHISKSKCTKHTSVGPLLEVRMSKKCTPLWRQAHFQVKMCKTHHCRTTFGSCDVEKVYAVVAQSTFPSQNVQNTPGSDHFWRFRCRFAPIHYTTGHYTTPHSSTLHYTPVHSTTLNYTTPHYITLNDTATQIDR